MAGLVEAVRENREKAELVVYLVGIVVFAGLLSPMLAGAWERAGLSRLFFRALGVLGFGVDPASALVLGFFSGSLLLMIYDTKKRLQGILLLGGSAIGLALLASRGLLLPSVSYFTTVVQWIGLGAVLGVVSGGGRQLVSANDAQVVELRRASRTVFYLLATVVVVGLVEYHVSYPVPVRIARDGQFVLTGLSEPIGLREGPQRFALDALLVAGFVATARRFVRYDAERDFLVMGPKASGKSLLLVGTYLEALERFSGDDETTPLNPSQDLMGLVSQLDREQDGWFVSATRRQELERLHFQYVYGSVFPLNVQVTGLDYAGEWLGDVPDVLLGAVDESEVPSTLARVRDAVVAADTLILLIDCERYANDEPLDVEPYFDILQAEDETDVILVATKADVMADRFREERGLNAEQYFEDFRRFLNDRLRTNQTVQSLVAQSGSSTIHPVFYQTRVNDAGERVPMRNAGSVATVGFDRLLERLGESG